ncbi:ankyrin repeat domain-containing protein SOWAHB-like [Synchiropus splendidus]|uniref:ankyrin repeat domain-containing protein SOWAHB-like n=1 Tax=Synchiropus splendidus TaxID=270530 RepID=UPI00237E18FE|nr:ankyrin repeat domain-containing protein SOWAHB-like [Synchiropus splendidus]
MAADLTQDAVLHFLQSKGGSVKNADLLLHFRGFLRDHADKERNRDLFKKFVNSVATVKQEEGVSYVVLRKKFREHVSSEGGGVVDPGKRRTKPQQRVEVPPAPSAQPANKTVLPVAGIMLTNNNNVETNFNLQHRTRSPPAPAGLTPAATRPQTSDLLTPPGQKKVGFGPGVAPASQTKERVTEPEVSLRQDPGHLKVSPRRVRHRQSYKTAVSQDDEEEEEEEEEEVVLGASVDPVTSLPGLITVAHSLPAERLPPKIYIQDVAAEPPRAGGPDQTGSAQVTPRPSLPSYAAAVRPADGAAALLPHSQFAAGHLQPMRGGSPDQRSGLPSTSSSLFSPSPKSLSPTSAMSASPKGPSRNRSLDDLQAAAGGTHHSQGLLVHEVLQRAQSPDRRPAAVPAELEASAPWHRSADRLHDKQEFKPSVSPLHHSTEYLHKDPHSLAAGLGWHRSTGDLYDDGESSEGSTSSPPMRPVAAKRLSSRLRNRMCRSLGANLDQLLPEEEAAAAGSEAARLNRLHMISSSLSLRYNLSSSSLSSCSTPPRSQSFADLDEALDVKGGRRSLPAASSTKQSLVPLEAREHAWLVKGAAGAWPDIYSLFREDSSLLNRRDFISGFTVLHWIAKHGDHRVLNTLWYGVEKAGLTLDVNARSTCGHTPLHIAAIHNNKNMLRLLVKKFDADVKLRDTAGKRAWQYLNKASPADVCQLLGAPARFGKDAEGAARAVPGIEPRQQRPRRRRRHYLSTASGERPLTIGGTTKVKRSSSIAAFLKHRSLGLRLEHKSDSSY